MGMIVGMSQCIVDVSKSDFILMIGRQLLFLAMILFVLCFGSMSISAPYGKYVPLAAATNQESKTKKGSVNTS